MARLLGMPVLAVVAAFAAAAASGQEWPMASNAWESPGWPSPAEGPAADGYLAWESPHGTTGRGLASPGQAEPLGRYPQSGYPRTELGLPGVETLPRPRSVYVDLAPSLYDEGPWFWQVLPDGLIYQSYMAGIKESRMSAVWAHDARQGWIWDVSLGGRMPILRYGTAGPTRIQGWQVDIEGAAFPRLDLEDEFDVMATDFRFGIPLTFGRGPYQMKIAYYHLSSHLGDELMLKHPHIPRINYSRDAFVWGHSYYWTEHLRLYAEAAWAFYNDGGSKPWEFQFGIDYSPAEPMGIRPVPFFAVNGHLREELDFGGNLVVQAGWQWRGPTAHRFRMGVHYHVGHNEQYQFFEDYENKVGLGLWYDF